MPQSLRDDLRALLALQDVDSKIEKARAMQAALDNGASTLAAYKTQKTQAEALRAAANKAQAEQHDAEMKLSSLETKAAQVQKTLYGGTVSSSRELENLQKELEMLGRQKGTAEEAVLLAMDATAEAIAAAEAAEKEQLQLGGRFKKIHTLYQARTTELQAELDALKAPRDTAAALVTRPDLLARYDSIRARRSGIGCAAVGNDDSCGACHTRVNATSADASRAGESIQSCEHCGRILTPTA